METEFKDLHDNKTWILVLPPPHNRVIGSKWVYKLKLKPDGTIECYKACLVAKGYHQTTGLNYFETFSPVVKPTTIHIILAIAISCGWSICQLDVHNAFLNGDLTEDVYRTQPQGFIDSTHPYYVCKLNESLYNLKQSPCAWFQKLSSFLASCGFVASKYDTSMFLYAWFPSLDSSYLCG